jgi:threonine dehydratase
MLEPPTIEDIRAAEQRIDGAVIRTPMLVSRTLSDIIGAEIWLKFENLQFTAAYKERGALNKLLQLTPEERARGVIAASAGNHAQAVAYHAKRLGTPATIVMPATTPTVKVTQTAGHGAKVVLHGERPGWIRSWFRSAAAGSCPALPLPLARSSRTSN